MRLNALLFALAQTALWGQEADSGFELRTTLTEAGAYSQQLSAAPRSDGPMAGGFRALLYPTLKITSHWTVAGTLQVNSRPYFLEDFSTQGYGIRADILQLHLTYARIWNNYSVVVRAGQLDPLVRAECRSTSQRLLAAHPQSSPLVGEPRRPLEMPGVWL